MAASSLVGNSGHIVIHLQGLRQFPNGNVILIVLWTAIAFMDSHLGNSNLLFSSLFHGPVVLPRDHHHLIHAVPDDGAVGGGDNVPGASTDPPQKCQSDPSVWRR